MSISRTVESLTIGQQKELFSLFCTLYFDSRNKENQTITIEDFKEMAKNPNGLFNIFDETTNMPKFVLPNVTACSVNICSNARNIFDLSPSVWKNINSVIFSDPNTLLELVESCQESILERCLIFQKRTQYPHRLITTKEIRPKVLELAKLSDDVYNDRTDGTTLPGNWRAVKTIYDEETNIRSRVYQKDKKYVYAIAGTNCWDDWLTNGQQYFFNKSPKFQKILGIANELVNQFSNIEFVGHSQGGGAAAYCAFKLQKHAYTFNPLGVDFKKTAKESSKYNPSMVEAYILQYDPLNMFLDFMGSNQADGIRNYISSKESIKTSHSIKTVIKEIGKFMTR